MRRDLGMTVNSKKLHTTSSSWCVCIQKVLCHEAAFCTTFVHCPIAFCSYIEAVFIEKILIDSFSGLQGKKKHWLRMLQEARIRGVRPQTPEDRMGFILDSKEHLIYW